LLSHLRNPVPPVFFVSYARADAVHPPYRAALKEFVANLRAAVAVRLARADDEIAFFDESSIAAGEVWTDVLVDALTTCSVGVALYTPNYFTRAWCGKEFGVFRKRRPAQPGASGIVPVLWMKCTTPPAVGDLQYRDGTFPEAYASVGMHQLATLQVFRDQYNQAVDAVAERIVAAVNSGGTLGGIGALEPEMLSSAWDESTKADPQSHKEGGVSKTCFVFVSREGWDWKPYPEMNWRIGALAQHISGELQLRYEEIACDEGLKDKLQETNESRVPTVLFGDPATLERDADYARSMREYDGQYLLNCAAIVPWDEASKLAGNADSRWIYLRTKVFPQKTEAPPPFHEWRSIFSAEELELRTRTTIEQIRSRLMRRAMSGAGDGLSAAVRKAEDPALSEGAAAAGISTELLGRLEGPRQ
jgi:hypothetical protein